MHIGMPTEPKALAKYYKEKFEKAAKGNQVGNF